MQAALSRSNEVVDVLLQAGADPNIVQSDGTTALCLALESGDLAIIDKLCAVTTTTQGREKAFYWIARKRIALSGPLATFVSHSLCTGREGYWQ